MKFEITTSNTVVWFIGLIGCLAITINLFLVYILYNQKSQWHCFSIQLIALTSIVDGLAGFSISIMALVRGILGVPEIYETNWYCSIFGMTTIYLPGLSGVLLTTMALERFLLICFQRHLPPRWTWLVLLIISIVFLVPALGTALTYGYQADPTQTHCVPVGLNWAKWLNQFTSFIFVVPLLGLTGFYLSIFITSLKLAPHSIYFVSRNLALRAILFLVIYNVCFLPKFVSSLWAVIISRESRPYILYVLGAGGLALSMVINPIMALFLHRLIREQVWQSFSRNLPGKAADTPSSQVNIFSRQDAPIPLSTPKKNWSACRE